MIMPARNDGELMELDEIVRTLADCRDLKQIKAIRDKAEAARHYARAASLSFAIQNRAAELKLRAERRAGELLMALVVRGGDRRSSAHDETLKLADLGIDHNQSSRWQQEARVPQELFEKYIFTANQFKRDISAQGLLRIACKLGGGKGSRNGNVVRNPAPDPNRRGPNRFGPLRSSAHDNEPNGRHEPANYCDEQAEFLEEMSNHLELLSKILGPFCANQNGTLRAPERRIIPRLLAETRHLVSQLQGQLLA